MVYLKKGQVAIEFLMMVSIAIFIFISIMLVLQMNLQERMLKRNEVEIKNLAFHIKDEIDLAHAASEGYYRKFYIPKKIGNRGYSAEIIEELIYIVSNDNKNAIAISIKEVNGDLNISKNIIYKKQGEVYLNV